MFLVSLHGDYVSVQYNGGLFPDIILLTQCGYIGEPFRYHEEVLSLQPMLPPKPLDIVFPESGCSEGLDAFTFFFKMSCASASNGTDQYQNGSSNLSISRATSIDSDCCRLPTTSVLSNKADKIRSDQFKEKSERI